MPVRFVVLCAPLALALLALPAVAATRHVPAQFATITAALAASSANDTVLVAPGTYSAAANGESFPLQMTTSGIRLIGSGMDVTTLDANHAASVIRHDAGAGARISGFRITGGSGSQGGGVDIVNGAVEIDHNRIDHNGASVGGAGVSARNASVPWMHHNLFLDNASTSSADVHAVRLNQTVTGTFENNLLAHTDGNGLLTVESAGSIVRNNIFYQNGIPSPLRGRGICWLSDVPATIHHNLFFQNQVAALLWITGGGDFSGTAANNFDALDGVYANLDGDPQFVNAAAGDYHLLELSPAVNSGDPGSLHDPDGTIADMGPFAFTHISAAPMPRMTELALSIAPNPLRSAGVVRYSLVERSHVQLDVLDLAGRSVRRVSDEMREGGMHSIHWDGRDDSGNALTPGIYYARIRVGVASQTVRVAVVR